MERQEIADRLREVGRRCECIHSQDNTACRQAAALLDSMGTEAHVLTYKEIRDLPDYAVVWEEWRGIPHDGQNNPHCIAPVARIGGMLVGNGYMTDISRDMFDGDEAGQNRWWNCTPTMEERRKTPWMRAAERFPTA